MIHVEDTGQAYRTLPTSVQTTPLAVHQKRNIRTPDSGRPNWLRVIIPLSLLWILVGPLVALGQTADGAGHASGSCIAGFADGFSCSGVSLLSFVPKEAIGGSGGTVNDIWGWTDRQSGREYGLVGLSTGTAFVDVTDPRQPRYLGILPTQSSASVWRDIKVYGDHALIVSEAFGHGMQVFDLKRLRNVVNPPTSFEADAVYTGIGSAHNIVVNEESGFAYAVGSRGGDVLCGPGLHMIDVRDPQNPVPAGCFAHTGTGRARTGYTHDAQCVIYRGPDADYVGREICIGSNETDISIADVTDKASPRAVASATYPTAQYIHQGWLTDDQRYFIQDDELDELRGLVSRTATHIWDLEDLDAPIYMGTYEGETTATDHNLYVVNGWAYMANYRAGLRVVDFTDIRRPREVAYFDTFPADDSPGTSGAWSVYPFFDSGSVLVSEIEDGFFILAPPFNEAIGTEGDLSSTDLSVSVYPNPLGDVGFVRIETGVPLRLELRLYDMLGRQVRRIETGLIPGGGAQTFVLDADKLSSGAYVLQVQGAGRHVSRLVAVAG